MTRDNPDEQNKNVQEKKIQGRIPSSPDIDAFWNSFGKKLVENTISGLDERAKYMITTCAGLIIVNLGLLLTFSTHDFSIKIIPQLFFAISAAFFAISYFPRTGTLSLASPDAVEEVYNTWSNSKIKWHRGGYALFIIGLFAVAITSLK